MQNEEKAKRKNDSSWDDVLPKPKTSPYRKAALILIFGILLGVFSLQGIRYLGMPHSGNALLDGRGADEIEALLLERLPLGASRVMVERFIAEHLEPSEACYQTSGDSLCRTIQGTLFGCSYWQWDIRFYFEDEHLSEISVESRGTCV
jgi:hypothetical protein